VGKGNIDKRAAIYAKTKKIKIIRCDITESINNFVKYYLKYFIKNNSAGSRVVKKNIKIISGGFIGKKGDIVVDSIQRPMQILGVSDGSGKFEKTISKSSQKKIRSIKDKFELDY
jgi:hypothetical protein